MLESPVNFISILGPVDSIVLGIVLPDTLARRLDPVLAPSYMRTLSQLKQVSIDSC